MALKTSGFNDKTAEHLLLDAGAVYKNFDEESMTGELIGATQGGNEILIEPEMRHIRPDGVKSDYVKGLTVIDSINVSLTTNLMEFTKDTLRMALGATEVVDGANGYDEIRGKHYIAEEDYLENIAYVGRISGNKEPVIVIIYNALSTEGLELNMEDAAEGILPVTFFGHVAPEDMDNPPYKILYPKTV